MKTVSTIVLCALSAICFAQDEFIRVKPSSCLDVCDGSAHIDLSKKDLLMNGQRELYWATAEEASFLPVEGSIINGLCAGQYRVRAIETYKTEPKEEKHRKESEEGYDRMNSYSFSTLGMKDINFIIALDKEVDLPDYYMSNHFSLDGKVWTSNTLMNQRFEKINDKSMVVYSLNLPRRCDDQETMFVEFHKRKANRKNGVPELNISYAWIESSAYDELVFQVDLLDNINVRSTVSNEVDGDDGYIHLEVEGGTPPYRFKWDDGSINKSKQGLKAGRYTVEITDSRGCIEESVFRLLAPQEDQIDGQFDLQANEHKGQYLLQIYGIYRRPLELTFEDASGSEIKKFKINPLYEDLDMDLDLSFLDSGEFKATLSTAGFSKIVPLIIE